MSKQRQPLEPKFHSQVRSMDNIIKKYFDEVSVEVWKRVEQKDQIKQLVFHEYLTDEQKITSLKMLLEDV